MEAKDLMIGDWVMDGDVAARVTSLTCDGIIETTHRISNIEVVEPVMLTPKILEKNKFIQVILYSNLFVFDSKPGEVVYYEYGPNFGLTIDNKFATIQDLKIEYVHELQHALRLCGIEKEIIL